MRVLWEREGKSGGQAAGRKRAQVSRSDLVRDTSDRARTDEPRAGNCVIRAEHLEHGGRLPAAAHFARESLSSLTSCSALRTR